VKALPSTSSSHECFPLQRAPGLLPTPTATVVIQLTDGKGGLDGGEDGGARFLRVRGG